MTVRNLRFSNGMQVHLIHQPEAKEAAALVRIAAGSHDEPAHWPGLAHLLEHMLFTGSADYQGDERLMGWVQGQGGRVNATTLAHHTALFFSLAPERFSQGLERLEDVIVAPLLAPEAIEQEVAVIDAEYRLLQSHPPTLSESALLGQVLSPAPFHAFHIGSAAEFGEDTAALRAALQQFHQHFYHAANMQLWLQGPQSLDALTSLAQAFSARVAQGEARQMPAFPALPSQTSCQLHVQGNARLWLSYLLPEIPNISDSVTLLREFLLDAAPGSLLFSLRERGWCDEIELKLIYQADNARWLALVFDTQHPAEVENMWRQLLAALQQTTAAQRDHYARLTMQRFAALTPLDQLRQRAFGFTPPASVQGFSELLNALQQGQCVRLFSSEQVQGEVVEVQGLPLDLADWSVIPQDLPVVPFAFYPQAAVSRNNPLPQQQVPLLYLPADTPACVLLRPDFYQYVSPTCGRAIGSRLQPLFAELRHQGGESAWREKDGVWQLTLRLPDVHTLEPILAALSQGLGERADIETDSITIRHLLTQLPEQWASQAPVTAWRAGLHGGRPDDHETISRLLTLFPATINPVNLAARSEKTGGVRRIAHSGPDSALLIFIPLPPQCSLAALRALALLYEPRFFHKLRVEQQVGYVVSCRYLRCVDEEGIVFALQSPDQTVATLLMHCKRFMREMDAQLDQLDEVTCAALSQRLSAQAAIATSPYEQLLDALRALQSLPALTSETVSALGPDDLRQLHQRLRRERRRWRVMFSEGE